MRWLRGRMENGSRAGWKPLLVLLVLTLLMISGCGSSSKADGEQGAQASKPVELRLAHFWPATHPVETELVQPWAEAVEEATGGSVKITSYPGQTLTTAEATYESIKTGVADIGLSCFAYTRGQFPVLEVFELPGITYANSRSASRVAWEGIQEFNPVEVQDTHLLMVLTTGPGDLYTNSPVRSLTDLKGMEIRATGLSAKTLETLGATPVAMPQSDAYEALSKATVKGNLGPIEVLEGWKQAEVTDYITRTPFLYNTVFFMTMNQEQWNRLSADQQEAIESVNKRFFEDVAMGLWDKQNESALKFAVEQNGMIVLTLPAGEADRWIKLVEPVQEDWVEKMNQQGINGAEILNRVKEMAQQYNRQYSKKGE